MLPSILVLLASSSGPPATLDRAVVPAAGRQVAHLQVSSFGRYGITVRSKQGVALQLVDKVSGPGAVFGRPGGEDGRIDAFFDRGTYRIVTHGDPKSTGEAKITVHSYREMSGAAPPALVELKPIDLDLGDFEQRSYWIDVRTRRAVTLEAAGRNLSDLRLWKDGTWLVDAHPLRDVIEPKVGQPLTVFRLAADLEPGLYLLTAYGGPAGAWAEDDGRHPFHLRFGIPSLPSVLRKRFTIGPFGYDRYLVSGANFFRLELPEARPVSIDLKSWSELQPFTAYSVAHNEITKTTVPPVAELDTGGDGTYQVTISGEEGEPYLLQHFRSLWYTPLPDRNHYWVSTVHAGHAEDSIDATGIVVESVAPHRALEWQTVELSGERPWGRKFNLLEQATVFIEVEEAGSYRIIGGGDAEATFRVEPFLITRPPNYQVPPFRASGETWELERGLFVLTIEPKKKGVLEVTMSKTGAFFDRLEALFAGDEKVSRLPRAQLRMPSFTSAHRVSWLYLNRQPGVRAGVLARPLPLDLRDALPITQAPGEPIEVPARFEEEGLLLAEAEDGSRLDISLDGARWAKSLVPPLGEHRVRVRHSGEHLIAYSLTFRPKRLDPDTPLPPLPDGRLAQLPKFPLLDEKPQYFELGRSSERSFLVRAGSPALFRLESTGLLATEGNLRTRVNTSLRRAQQNGIGRNFLAQQYLGTGDYQITVRTLGASRGHLGLRLKRTPQKNGGRLAGGVPARTTLRAGHAVVYSFRIGREGRYRLRAIGRDRTLRCRLEDADGWPIVEPNVEADFDRVFDAGRYRLVVLPEAVDVRVVALLEKIDPPPSFTGHGPHRIALDQTIEHTWIESAPGPKSKPEARRRDVWVVQVPAKIQATVLLSGKMHGDLIRIGENGAREKVAYVPPLRGWSGELAPGEHRLEVFNLHESSDVPYTVAVRSAPLVVGIERTIAAPAVVPLAIGERGLVEISSFGTSDVEARLTDANGRVIAKSDDRPDDWNFHLATRLEPGAYALSIRPVGRAAGSTQVTVRARAEAVQDSLQIPVKKRLVVGREVHVHELTIPEDARFLAIVARSSETLGLVLEREADAVFQPIATSVGRPARIELPLLPGASKRKHRIKLWSADERNLPIDLVAVAIEPELIDEDDLEDGEELERSKDLPIAVAEVSLDRPGTFWVRGAVRWTSEPGAPARAPVRGLIHPNGTRLFLVKDTGRRRSVELTGKRAVLWKGTLDLQVTARTIDVDLRGEGPVLVRVDATKAQPGACVLAPDERIAPSCFDVRAHGAVSVHLDAKDAVARLWSAEEVSNPLDASLEVHRFEPPEPAGKGAGSHHGRIPAGGAISFELPAGRKRLALAMEEGAVAVLARGSEKERVAWASGDTEVFEGKGRSLVLLNPGPTGATYAIEVLPLLDDASPLASPYERRAVRSGRRELIVPPGPEGRRLFVRGGDAVFIDSEGMVHRGDRFLVDRSGGSLRIEHGIGMLMAWIDPPGVPGGGLFGALPRATDVPVPSAIPLSGGAGVLRLKTDRPRMLHVRLESPILARWERDGAPAEILVRDEGGTLDLYLPRGQGTLALRPIGGGALHGSAEITASPVEPIGEGLGPEVMIAPGSGRAFAFELKQRSPIGIGVRSDGAEVEALLVSANGQRVGRGVVQMHELEADTYLLYVSAPAGSRPLRARPALVGIEAPPSGPPAEVIQSYLRGARDREP